MIVEALAKLWAVNDSLPNRVDLIVPVAHGATKSGRVTKGADAVGFITRGLLRLYADQSPVVVFGVFSKSEYPDIEEAFKSMLLPNAIFVKGVVSTIEECLKVKAALAPNFAPKRILVVTDEAHSRRCRIVWRVFFPDAEIYIVAVPISETKDKESPMLPYHSKWATLIFQALPTPYFWYLAKRGPDYMSSKAESLHQPVTPR